MVGRSKQWIYSWKVRNGTLWKDFRKLDKVGSIFSDNDQDYPAYSFCPRTFLYTKENLKQFKN